jgi:hypothetical protein
MHLISTVEFSRSHLIHGECVFHLCTDCIYSDWSSIPEFNSTQFRGRRIFTVHEFPPAVNSYRTDKDDSIEKTA